jgi:DNA-binding NtrC family response regulator
MPFPLYFLALFERLGVGALETQGKIKILVVDDDPLIRRAALRVVTGEGYVAQAAASGQECLTLNRDWRPDLILLDVVLPDIPGTEVCRRIKTDAEGHRPYVILTSGSQISSHQQAAGLDVGADGYIARPVSNRELAARLQAMVRIKKAEEALQEAHDALERRVETRTAELAAANRELTREIEERKTAEHRLSRALEEIQQLQQRLQKENVYLREEIKLAHNFEEIVGISDALKYVLYKIEQVAPTAATALVMGETGTGKELVARAIHHASRLRDRPLVKVNCATLPANLIESELFGHEKGAFTGAQTRQTGRFELADGGTIFLDEIGELPLSLQSKLLRVLQDGEFERLGSGRTLRIKVRVIAATNRNLADEVRQGRFREDLWYRINVFPITVPPLRKRREDIPPLITYFTDRFGTRMGKKIELVPPAAVQALKAYPWPGNVRELRNVIERAVILSTPPVLNVEIPLGPQASITGGRRLAEVERDYILQVLEACNWKIEGDRGAARVLDLNPGTLRSRMKKLAIRRPIAIA